MKAVYEITTEHSGDTTTRNYGKYITVASNFKEAVKKTEEFLKNNNAEDDEQVDEVRVISEIDF